MSSFILTVHRSAVRHLAGLLPFPDIRVSELAELVWIRGSSANDEALESVLRTLPVIERYELVGADRLRPSGRLVPTGRLPRLAWRPLKDWTRLHFPSARLPASDSDIDNVAPRLVESSGRMRVADVLLADGNVFRDFVLYAPEHRLFVLKYVVDTAGKVLVLGTPLPSIPGERFALRSRIAVPAGLEWSPALSENVMVQWLGLAPARIALWHADGSLSEIDRSQLAPVTRSSVVETVG